MPPQTVRWQWPSLHEVPVQHSSLLVQAPPSGRQPQTPLTQAPVQQSDAAAQVPPGSAQAHTFPVQLPRQQSAVATQETRGARQVWQAPPLQRLPAQHNRLASHRPSSCTHAGAHDPLLQLSPAQHAVPVEHEAPWVPQPVWQVLVDVPVVDVAVLQNRLSQQSPEAEQASSAALQRGLPHTRPSHARAAVAVPGTQGAVRATAGCARAVAAGQS